MRHAQSHHIARLCSFGKLTSAKRKQQACPYSIASDKAGHNATQASIFDAKVNEFQEPLPNEILERLRRIAYSAPLSNGYRAIDVGSGTGCLIPHLQAAGWTDILAVDVSAKMLEALQKAFSPPATVGNEGGVRTWHGDIADLPGHQGRAHAIFMNAVFGNLSDPHEALLNSTFLLQPEGFIVISHPLGRAWHDELVARNPTMCPHHLPDRQQLDALIADLPLKVTSYVDEPEFYCVVLKIPKHFAFPGAPLKLQGPVVSGFQRGSKQMGIPTANIAPAPLEQQLKPLPRGVYFGWAKLMEPTCEADGQVVKMVMNVGIRPTIKDGSNMTVEVHILHKYDDDFYGKELRVIATGFIRPERRMPSLDALIARIRTDISIASTQLDSEACQALKSDDFFMT